LIDEEAELMQSRLVLVVTFAVASGSAALVAFILGYVAHYDFGLSRVEIRDSAFIAAALIVMILGMQSIMRRGHGPK
jgi:small-conductance mechanosensitive channel